MNNTEVSEACKRLMAADTPIAVAQIVTEIEEKLGSRCTWTPVGRENNQGPIEVASDPGRSLVERVTNAVDAILDRQFRHHNGKPEVDSPHEAAAAWFGLAEGLSSVSQGARRNLSKSVTVRVTEGEGRALRTVEVRDLGTGLGPAEMPGTILSLNASNKRRKFHLMGAYGQGGSSTFAVSKFTLIASKPATGPAGFTVVRFNPPDEDEEKLGDYVYLRIDDAVPTADLEADFPQGTLVKHFGYDLSGYPSPFGANSVYGLLNLSLFDPPLPVWLEVPFLKPPQKRTIVGFRNALNGGDDDEGSTRPPKAIYKMPLFFPPGANGLGIEYWVLPPAEKKNKHPNAAYAPSSRPIVLTRLGQTHSLQSVSWIKKGAGLIYLTQRILIHVDCNALPTDMKRALFVSNREDARRGAVLDLIKSEIINSLKSDDELKRLNEQAKHHTVKERAESDEKEVRSEVARLLKLQGVDLDDELGLGAVSAGGASDADDGDEPRNPRGPRKPPKDIPSAEPPTYIKIVWGDEKKKPPIKFYPGQRRYIRVETDASEKYHDLKNPGADKINVVLPDFFKKPAGTSPLVKGRLRVIAETLASASKENEGMLRIELLVPGQQVKFDERKIEIVDRPPAKPESRKLTLPPIERVPVDGPDDDMWSTLGWPDDVSEVAVSSDIEDDGVLRLHYSTAFPQFASRRAKLEKRSVAQAAAFTRRYEIWLAVHALLRQEAERKGEDALAGIDDEQREAMEMREGCRIAAMAVLFAAKETADQPTAESDEDD